MGSKKWSNSGYILKVKSIGFAVRLGVNVREGK